MGKHDTNTLSNGVTKWYATDEKLQFFVFFNNDQEIETFEKHELLVANYRKYNFHASAI